MSELKKKAKPLWKLQYGEQPPPVPSKTKYVELSDAQAEIDTLDHYISCIPKTGLEATDKILELQKEVKELKKFKERIERTVHPRYWQQSR